MSTCNVYRFLILFEVVIFFVTFISIFMSTELQLRAPQLCVSV